jgi:hypothetical protein
MRQRLICSMMLVAAATPAFGIGVFSLSTDDSSFALLGSTITETGDSTIAGNVGATTTLTQNGAWTVSGTIFGFPSDPTVAAAYGAFESDFGVAAGLSSTGSFTGTNQIFTGSSGNNVYASSSTISTSASGTTLTFNAQNQSNVVFVIQIDGSLTVNNAITFVLENGALASNIFWIVGNTSIAGSATIDPVGAPITWDGNILAGSTGGTFTMSSIGPSSALAGTVNGCVFTNAANTLAGETIVNGCFADSAGGTPEPGTAGLVGLGGLLGAGLLSIRARRKFRL